MEWPLINTQNGADAVAQANYPEIRLFTVQKTTSSTPLDDVKGQWIVTTPEKVGQFSAVGYFFGRELYEKLKVPVGLIHTSWGGTPAEAWTSNDALSTTSDLQPILARYQEGLKNVGERQQEYERRLAEWSQKICIRMRATRAKRSAMQPGQTNTADWPSMNLPQYFETAGLKMDGAIWFRKEIEIPQSGAGRSLELNLAAIDDFDTTYFNGTKVGGIEVKPE
jgi:sialate O-acetylesterase